MKRSFLWVFAGLIALVGGIGTASRAADDVKAKPSATGTVKVTVKDETGKPVSGVTVSILERAGKKTADKTAPPASRKAAEPVAQAVTDDKGIALMNEVPVGQYNLNAKVKKGGAARGKVNVASGATADITLDLKAAKKAK